MKQNCQFLVVVVTLVETWWENSLRITMRCCCLKHPPKNYIVKPRQCWLYRYYRAKYFDEIKIRDLLKKTDICINLAGILLKVKKEIPLNVHSVFPSLLAISKDIILHFVHLSALGINDAVDSDYAKVNLMVKANS